MLSHTAVSCLCYSSWHRVTALWQLCYSIPALTITPPPFHTRTVISISSSSLTTRKIQFLRQRCEKSNFPSVCPAYWLILQSLGMSIMILRTHTPHRSIISNFSFTAAQPSKEPLSPTLILSLTPCLPYITFSSSDIQSGLFVMNELIQSPKWSHLGCG